MADPITGALVSQLGAIIQQQIDENIRLVVGVDTEIELLEFILKSIQAVILDADNKQVREHSINLWLERLGDVCYDLDDVLADWSIALFKYPVENNTPDKKVCCFIKSPCFCFGRIIVRRDIALKIKNLHEKLNEIHLGRERYKLNDISSSNVGVERLPTTSFVDESKIKGRNKDKTILVKELLKGRKDGLNIVSVVGMGGIGKTTLAQVAYNSDEVKDHFEMRLWVVVSEKFDLVKIAKAIIESIDRNKDPELFGFDIILNSLSEKIKDKRYLLVLDDVWTYEIEKWEPLISSLRVGAYGSKILVTTRDERVAINFCSTKIIQLDVLSDEDCWDLFSQYAFLDRRNENLEHLKPIGRDIAYKCKGLPLAAKTIGSSMRIKNTLEDWKNVLNSYIWDLEETDNVKILPSLLLSYHALEEYACRRCFRYCAIFPKDTEIEAENLINLWMANGYLISKGKTDMEDIGRKYLDNLAMRCFFQDLKRDEYTINIKQFKMHDLVHDLAQHLTKNECSTIEVVDSKSPRTEFRHLTLVITKDVSLQSIQGDTTKLHTLRVPSTNFETEKFLPDLFKHLLHLKVLDISDNTLKEVPNDIGKLLNLRYLNLSNNGSLKELPETLCELYNLQTLYLDECTDLERLPEGIGKLEKLRHLKIDETMSLRKLPRGIRNLRFLQTLDKVVLSNMEDTFNLGDLMDLKQLQSSSFYIENLGYANVADAKKAKLKEKQHLVEVRMDFKPQTLSSEEVAEALELHHDVKLLRIWNYGGVRFPSWIISLNNVRKLELKDCRNCTVLPPLGKLQSLEKLWISRMENVKRIGEEFLGIEDYSNKGAIDIFPKLKKLWFFDMENWEEWDLTSPAIVKGVEDGNLRIMPCLKSLVLTGCDKLKELPPLGKLQSLETLHYGGDQFPNWIISLQNLRELKLKHCSNCTVLPPLGKLQSLERLLISRMKNVKRIGEEFLGIEDYSNKGAIDIFPKLKDLHFAFMENWEEWDLTSPAIVKGVEDGNLRIMPCLQFLKIDSCRKLKEVPALGKLQSLEKLWISRMENVKRIGEEFLGIEDYSNKGAIDIFPKLKELYFEDMENWEEWDLRSPAIVKGVEDENLRIMPCLQYLTILSCRKLKEVPEILLRTTQIQKPWITDCPLLEQKYGSNR